MDNNNTLWRRMLGMARVYVVKFFQAFTPKCLKVVFIGFTWADYQRIENSLFQINYLFLL